MNAECRTIAPSDLARSAGGAAFLRWWRWSGALRAGVLAAAAVALAGYAGVAGPMAPVSGTASAPGTSPAPAGTAAQNRAAPFTAAVDLVGASLVRLGDPVSFVLSAGTAGYGHLYLLNTSGSVVALAENLAVAPDAPMLFPVPDAGFTVRARPPVGADRVLLLVTRQPLQGFGGGGGAPVTLAVRVDAFVAQLNAATARLAADSWALAETRVEVVAAGGYDPGPADGVTGSGTRGAVRRWQAARGEPLTGHLDADGAKAMLALGKREAEESRRVEAERRADDEAFGRAKRLHTESGYRAYLSRGGRHEAEARALLSEVTRPRWEVGDEFRDCPECPEMVVVPSGSFQMGSPESEAGRDGDEGPVHRVTIARPFAVGVHEVTREEFARFVSATGRSMGNACWTYADGEWEERSGHDWRNPGFGQTDEHPVVCVSWRDAQAYVEWLSKETGAEYRLLSQSEWEYVARAGTTTRYWWGDEIGRSRANCDGCGSRWDNEQTAPVGSFSANAFGLYDVHGNVWEWVEDCWNGDYHGAPSDGSAWGSGDCRRRVLRGGSWSIVPRFLRSANRGGHTSGNRFDLDGFRVARTLTP